MARGPEQIGACGLADFAGLLAWRPAIVLADGARPSRCGTRPETSGRAARSSGLRGVITALQSRGGDGILLRMPRWNRGPSSRARSPRLVWRSVLARFKPPAQACRDEVAVCIQPFAGRRIQLCQERGGPEPSGRRRSNPFRLVQACLPCTITRGRPEGPMSTASDVSKTCSSSSR